MRESLASPDIDDPDAEPQRRVYAAILALQTCITLKVRLDRLVQKPMPSPLLSSCHQHVEPQTAGPP